MDQRAHQAAALAGHPAGALPCHLSPVSCVSSELGAALSCDVKLKVNMAQLMCEKAQMQRVNIVNGFKFC